MLDDIINKMLDDIINKINDFTRLYGREPENIYLGSQEWDELMRAPEIRRLHSPCYHSMKIAGCSIYRVSVKNHFGLS